MNFYNKIREFVTKYSYFFYGFLLCLFFGSCFNEIFVYISCIYILLISIFADPTFVLSLILFIIPYEELFNFDIKPQVYFFRILNLLLVFNLFIRYLIISIKEKSIGRIKILVGFSIYIIYCLLPPHKVGINDFCFLCADLCLIYIIFQKKFDINFKKLIEVFCLALIFSCFMGLLREYSARLTEVIPIFTYLDVIRFSGLMRQPNIFGMIVSVCLSLLCILKYFNKLNNIKFILYSSLLMFFGLKTISRSFIIITFAMYLVFSIFYLIKYKNKALKDLAFLYLGLLLSLIFSLDNVLILFERLNINKDTAGNLSIDNIYLALSDKNSNAVPSDMEDKIFSGEIFYDPGRKEIWKLYIRDIFSSVQVFLFGRGISRNWIGQMATHNDYMQLFWINGLIGTIIYIINILLFIDFKKINWANIKNNLFVLIYLVPIAMVLLIEHHPLGKFIFLFVILIIDFGSKCKLEENSDKEQINIMAKTNKNE